MSNNKITILEFYKASTEIYLSSKYLIASGRIIEYS